MSLPARDRLDVWWRTRPLGTTFTVYLVVYLASATALALAGTDIFDTLSSDHNNQIEFEVGNNSLMRRVSVDGGPYIYDVESDQLLPAAELDLPESGPLAVFIATGGSGENSPDGFEDDRADEAVYTLYATTELLREGKIKLYDWGLNYNDWYPQEEILDDTKGISADDLAHYDRVSRERRVQSVELFGRMTGADLEATFGENLVSNTAYYAAPAHPMDMMSWLLALAIGLCPILTYGGLGWLTFRHFYRVHIAEPLASLSGAADRIAGRDLDFSIEAVRGRELRRLSSTLENMRASLLEAQRELWRTAESRRHLNAAFAHDLRTPITVLKGTVEMAQMRLRRGDALDRDSLDALSSQVARLERYADSMGGLTKLEDRPIEREAFAFGDLREELGRHVSGVVAARGSGLAMGMPSAFERDGVPGPSAKIAEGDRPGAPLFLDLALVEEVLDNLLGNACAHASSGVSFDMMLDAGVLTLVVTDDGPGFTPEALKRGCDPFYSENKSAEHFGLGLNVSSILCALHGGQITLANAEAGGARVIATFDVRP